MLMEFYEQEKPNRILLLGDLLSGYSNYTEREEVAGMLNQVADSILAVRGNCDDPYGNDDLLFSLDAESELLELAGKRTFMTHGHIYGRYNLPPIEGVEIILHGHTHVPAWEALEGGVLYLNPGSVSLPRQGSQRSFLIVEDAHCAWYDLETGYCYHEMELN